MKITLYTTNCTNCKMLELKLKQEGIDFEIIENRKQIIEKGYMSAPILEVDDKTMTYYEAIEWVNNFKEDNIEK